jgi:hypothetical protein
MTILSPGLVNRKGVEGGNICVLEISIFPLSTPFLLNRPGERIIMYLCARDIDVSSFYNKYMIILSPGLVNRKGVERGNIDIPRTQIHDYSLSWLGQ